MKSLEPTLKIIALIVVIDFLTGCGDVVIPTGGLESFKTSQEYSDLMKPAEAIKAGPDYAVVNFMRASGWAIPKYPRISLWDNENFVGLLESYNYIQYNATPGEHIFMGFGSYWAAIKANVQAGKTYYVLTSMTNDPIRFDRVSFEVLKPDDEDIDYWIMRLKPVALDKAQWDAEVMSYESSTSPQHTRDAWKLEKKRRQQLFSNVQNGSEQYVIMNPQDGRYALSTQDTPAHPSEPRVYPTNASMLHRIICVIWHTSGCVGTTPH